MKKARKYIIIATALLLSVSAHAQIFIVMEEDLATNLRVNDEPASNPFVPVAGTDFDQSLYTPLGSGCLALAALGGAYLLGKRRRKDEE